MLKAEEDDDADDAQLERIEPGWRQPFIYTYRYDW